MAKAAKTKESPAPAPAPAAPPSTAKSIVNPKYRDAYKDPAKKDWLSHFLDDNAMKTREKTVTKTEGDEKVTTTTQVPDGVDADKLFAIAKANGVDTAKYEAQAGSHGFAGRMRMTLGNVFRRVIKERHGLNDGAGEFHTAPADMLTKVGAGETPTHTHDGAKIVPPKPAADEAAKK